MLFGVGIQPLEKLRSGRVLEFNGGDESENIVPILLDQLGVDIEFRQDFAAEIFINFTLFKRIESMFGKLFKPGRKGKTEQMGDTENDFGKTVRIG